MSGRPVAPEAIAPSGTSARSTTAPRALKVFIGMAAGVGKTYRMLLEGHAEQEAGGTS
jgi:K+-sensing histidine kinase KdpD